MERLRELKNKMMGTSTAPGGGGPATQQVGSGAFQPHRAAVQGA